MRKEKFKAEFLASAKKNPESINLFALADNLGESERKIVYATERVYQFVSPDLLIRFVKREGDSEPPTFDIQFCNGFQPPSDWDSKVHGFLYKRDLTRVVAYEKMEFAEDSITFSLKRVVVKVNDSGTVLVPQEEKLNITKCDFSKGYICFDNQSFIDYIRLAGRHRSVYGFDCFVDYQIKESELQDLFLKLTKIGIRHKFTKEEMQKVKDVVDYCRKARGTKRKSKMVRIMEHLRDLSLPYRFD